jgi:NADP-dependent 3-hydroxy acid dehydrogenase YdfG
VSTDTTHGRVAVITGAPSSIGEATARALADELLTSWSSTRRRSEPTRHSNGA